jgi:beta-lactamase regulating signal transducer with metallopeptidase domain
MNSSPSWLSGDPTLVWGLSVLLQVTVITTVALVVARCARRIPVLRYWILCSSLFLVLLTPCLTLVMQLSGISLLTLSVTQDSLGAADDLTESAPVAATFPSSSRENSGDDLERVRTVVESTGDPLAWGPSEEYLLARSYGDPASSSTNASDASGSAGAHHTEVAASASRFASPRSDSPRIGDWPRMVMRPVMFIWFTGTLFFLARLIVNWCRLAVMLRSAKSVASAPIALLFEEVVRESGIRQVPEIVFSDRVSSPISAGLIRPRVILPERLVDRVNREQLRDILLHELAHIERRDPAIVLMQHLSIALFWLHPLVRILNRELAKAREEVCDNFVLAVTDGPSYSRTLLALTELVQVMRPLPGAVGLFTAHWKLEHRIAGLLDDRRNRMTRLTTRGKTIICLLSLGAAALAAMGTLTPAASQEEQAERAADTDSNASLEATTSTTSPDDDEAEAPTVEPITISGRVLTAGGQPAGHAVVEIFKVTSPPLATEITADAEGLFETKVPIKRESLASTRMRASSMDGSEIGYYRFPWDGEATASTSVQITLERTRTPRITVVDADGNPIPDANVAVQLDYPHTVSGATTDRSGTAMLRIPESERIQGVVAWKDHAGLDYRLYKLSREQQADVAAKTPEFPASGEETLKLDGVSPLTVRAVDDQNQPLVGTRVYPWLLTKDTEPDSINLSYFTPNFSQTTDVNGETTFPWIPSWHQSVIQVWPDAKGFVRTRGNYDPQSGAGLLELELARLVPIRGRVLDAAGNPVEGIAVAARGEGYTLDGGRENTMTDKQGQYELLVPPDQVYLVVVTDAKWAAAPQTGFAVFRNQPVENKDFVLRPATRVHGTLIDEVTGKPIPGEIVTVYQFGQDLHSMTAIELPNPENSRRYVRPAHVFQATTDAQGRFQFSLGDGSFDIRPPRPALKVDTFEIAGEAELEFQVTTQVHQQVKLVGVVTAKSDGTPLEGVRVSGVPRPPSGGRDWLAVTAADGSFQVQRYRDPTFLHAVTSNGQLGAIVEIEATRDSVGLQLQPVGSATGRLLTADSAGPIGGRRINYLVRIPSRSNRSWSSRFGGQVITDSDGRFQLEGLVPGWEYMLDLEATSDGITQTVTKVTVSPGEAVDLGDVPAPLPPKRYVPPTLEDQIRSAFDVEGTPLEQRDRAFELIKLVGQHLLIVFGVPDDLRIRRLMDIRFNDREFDAFRDEFRFMAIATDEARRAEAQPLADSLDESLSDGRGDFLLVIVNRNGMKVAAADGSELCDGDELSKNRLFELLRPHLGQPVDARELLDEALQRAAMENKRVIVQETATWCGPCHLLSRFLKTHRVWEKDYIRVEMDHRWNGARELIAELRDGAEGGIPWFAILDESGKVLATSNDPSTGRNIGYPSEKNGQDHFAKMLNATRQRLTEDEIQQLVEQLSGTGN